MPANLTPQYLEAEKRFKAAESPQGKVEALQEMMAIIPKHKGTEKIRAELKRKLSVLRKESHSQEVDGKKRSLPPGAGGRPATGPDRRTQRRKVEPGGVPNARNT